MFRRPALPIPLLLSAAMIHAAPPARLSDDILPFVGAQGEGNTFPGPSTPFGMIQLSPDTDTTDWATSGGYEYTDPTIQGFSLTHLSGTGCPDLGDFLFVPQTGRLELNSGTKAAPDEGYQSRFSHEEENASAGYYRVRLKKSDVLAELTAGDRVGMLRFTFPESREATLLTDLSHAIGPWKTAQARVRIVDDATVTGFRLLNGWVKDRPLYYAARYSRPFDTARIYSDGKEVKYDSFRTYRFRSAKTAAGPDLRFVAGYATHAGETITVKVALSSVSEENALRNLDTEAGAADFEALRESAKRRWDEALRVIEFADDEPRRKTLRTALYHTLLTPNLREDANREYRGQDQRVHATKSHIQYSIFSLWDTYRAEHPLLALIDAKRDSDMVNSLLALYDQSADKMLPIWELQGGENWCMIGYHAVPVIVDAYFRGVKGFDPERAYAAIRTTAMNPDYDGVKTYADLGYVPFDKENESLSKTLEYAYDDWCIARMARALGKTDDAAYFEKRSRAFANLYDPSIGFMRSKDSAGKWREPFDPHMFGGGKDKAGKDLHDVTEATPSQYSWYVPHDVPALIGLMGGREKFIAALDAHFTDTGTQGFLADIKNSKDYSPNDLKAFIGEYWHGNEPAHHVAYLYSLAGAPEKAARRLREIVDTQYGDGPGSLCGNDDCGQMSAWYLFTCLGFYPVCPGGSDYVIGAPQIATATMHLSNGNTFRMNAKNLSKANLYVQSVTLNGKPLETPLLPCDAVLAGGTLEFVMGPKPSAWAAAPAK